MLELQEEVAGVGVVEAEEVEEGTLRLSLRGFCEELSFHDPLYHDEFFSPLGLCSRAL